MNIQKGDAITFLEWLSCDIQQLTANFAQPTNRDMPRNKRVRDTCQATLLEMNVRAADLA
jgi:hypothetical protein